MKAHTENKFTTLLYFH